HASFGRRRGQGQQAREQGERQGRPGGSEPNAHESCLLWVVDCGRIGRAPIPPPPAAGRRWEEGAFIRKARKEGGAPHREEKKSTREGGQDAGDFTHRRHQKARLPVGVSRDHRPAFSPSAQTTDEYTTPGASNSTARRSNRRGPTFSRAAR